MKRFFKVFTIFSFLPLGLLLLFALAMSFTWVEVIRQLITGDYPEGNPDQLTYESAIVPLLMMIMGVIGSFGLFSFLSGLNHRNTLIWKSKSAYFMFCLAGFIPCVWLSYKGLPGVTSYYAELVFTFLVPVIFMYFSYKLRFTE